MMSKRLKKVGLVVFLLSLSAFIAFLIIYALKQNVNLFYTPSQIAQNEAPASIKIRVGGMVEKNSLRYQQGTQLEFYITDFQHRLKIAYNGILPDLFREGQGVVALGYLNNHHEFIAEQILAKHDENYMPPELKGVHKPKDK